MFAKKLSTSQSEYYTQIMFFIFNYMPPAAWGIPLLSHRVAATAAPTPSLITLGSVINEIH